MQDLATGSTIAACVLAENFTEHGLYLSYRVNDTSTFGTSNGGSKQLMAPVMPKGIRFRIHQVHSEGDGDGWAPPPMLTAIFFD